MSTHCKTIFVSLSISSHNQYYTRITINDIVRSHYTRRDFNKLQIDPKILSICDSLQEHVVHSLLDLIFRNRITSSTYEQYSTHLSSFFEAYNGLYQQVNKKPLKCYNQSNFEDIFALDQKLSQRLEITARRLNQPSSHIRLVDVLLAIDQLFLATVIPNDHSEDSLRPYEFCQQFREDCLETLVTIISLIDTSNTDKPLLKQLSFLNNLNCFTTPFAIDIFESPFNLQSCFVNHYLDSYEPQPNVQMTFFAKLCLVIVCFSLTHMITYDAKVLHHRKGTSKFVLTDHHVLATVGDDPIFKHLFQQLRFIVPKESKHVE